jgi:hypothetical protein
MKGNSFRVVLMNEGHGFSRAVKEEKQAGLK